jgi:hypothetical protein
VDLGLFGSSDLSSRTPGQRQCVLVTDLRLFKLEQHLWLDNLYILYNTTARSDESNVLDCLGGACNMWLTSVTLQASDNNLMSDYGGAWIGGGQLYAERADPNHCMYLAVAHQLKPVASISLKT